MRAQVTVFNKNFYSMDNGNSGANLLILGDYIETGNKVGMSVSEASIEYSEHHDVSVFPAVYEADISFGELKASSGKVRTAMILKNLKFLHEVDVVPKKG